MQGEIRPGYKQTEVGVIPEDWQVLELSSLFRIQSGLAFSSEYYAKNGPILLTPGNFSLDGKLVFNDRNTKRFSGPYPKTSIFCAGDLLVVMTDLTPDCNLLGKPAFFNGDEIVLHNQRIGKIVITYPKATSEFLYRYFLSDAHAKRMKETATGSTVRHTSNRSIYDSRIVLPPLPEQRAIVAALSDADGLIAALEAMIAKKRDLKQAAMQHLLTGKTRLPGFAGEWEVKRIGEVTSIQRGASPRPIDSPIWFDEFSRIGWVRISDVSKSDMFLTSTTQRLSLLGIARSRSVELGSLIMSIAATVGRPAITQIECCIHDGFVVFSNLKMDKVFLYFVLRDIEPKWSKQGQTGSQMNLNSAMIERTEILLPPSLAEQTAIAEVLSDMDADLAALEAQAAKARAVKQGMMQELLTGRVRLV